MDRIMLLSGRLQDGAVERQPDVALAWTDGRVDEEALRERIDLLARTYPEFSSRLVERGGGRAHWALVREPPAVRRHEFPSDADVLRMAAALVTEPMDLERGAPAEFHLLRVKERDILLLRWSHLLMNGNGFDRFLEELPHLTGERREVEDDPARAYLRQLPLRRKLDIVTRHLRDRLVSFRRDSGDAIALVRPPAAMGGDGVGLDLALRELDVDRTRAMEERARAVAGLGGLVPAIVASCFRAVARIRGDVAGSSVCSTNVPVALWSPPAGRPPMTSNLSASLPIEARGEDLYDRDALTALVARQVREYLRSGFDVGQILLATWLVDPAGWPVVRGLWRPARMGVGWKPKTLGFSHRGTVTEDALEVCGARITRTHLVHVPWTGLFVATALCGGRLQLSVSVTMGEGVEGTADRIADAILEDLESEAGLGPVATRQRDAASSVT